MPHDIDRKALRDLLSDDSDSDSVSGIYEYADTSRELICKYPTSSTRYTGSSSKKSYPAPSTAYDDQYIGHDTFADRHKHRDYPQPRRHPQDRTDGELTSLFQQTTTNLFGRTLEEASFDFLQQVRPRVGGRHDGTPSLISDDTRSGSSSSRLESPAPVRQRHRSPPRRAHRVISQITDSTPHIRDIREDATVCLPSIRELDQNINGVSMPAPPSPPGYASRREYEQRRNYLVPRVVTPDPPSWYSGYPYEEHDQRVNSPIPRIVSPEPHVRPRYPTREVHWRANYPSSQATTQDNHYTGRYPIRDPEQRSNYRSVRDKTPDLHSESRYPKRAPDQRINYASTNNILPDPPSLPIYPNRQSDQRIAHSNARTVSLEIPLSNSTLNKPSEQAQNYPLTRLVSPEPPSSPLYSDYSFAPILSSEPSSTPPDFNRSPELRSDCSVSRISPERSLSSTYPDLQTGQESVHTIARLISPELPSTPSTASRQSERRSNHALARAISSVPPSITPNANIYSEQESNHLPTQVITPAPPSISASSDKQPDQRLIQAIIAAPVLTPIIPNREPEQGTNHDDVVPAVAQEPHPAFVSTNREPAQEIEHPTPLVVTPEPLPVPQYPDDRAVNIIESIPSALDLSDATRKAIYENNRTSEWDFSAVNVDPPAVTVEVPTPASQRNKRKASSPKAAKPPKVPKVPKTPKAPKQPKAPKATVPVPASQEENEIDELAGDDDSEYVDSQPPTDCPQQERQKAPIKRPAIPISYTCEYCAKVFTRNFDKRRHIKSIHQEQSEDAIQSRTCPCCNEVLSREDAFRRHIVKVPDSCIRLAELRSMPLTIEQKKRLLKMHQDGIPPKFPFDELFYMYRR